MPTYTPSAERITPNLIRLSTRPLHLWASIAPLLLGLLVSRPLRAEDSATFRAQSWQEDNNRIRVDSQYALLEADATPSARIKVMGLLDSIAGVSPTGEKPANPGDPVPLGGNIEDTRKAWDANFAYQFPRVNVSASFGNSRENDYVSNGYSLNTVTDFNQKNTTLLVGVARTDDRIMPRIRASNIWADDRFKKSQDFIIGLTQLLTPNTAVTANVTYGRTSGYLSDPYKIVTATLIDEFIGPYAVTYPENRPRKKEKAVLFLGLNQALPSLDAAVDASYRYYQDAYGIQAHTVDLKWIQSLGAHFRLEPFFRYSRQSAAEFYYADMDQTPITVSLDDATFETGTGSAPYYSSDYRLSEMETINLGLKFTWLINDHFALDVAYDRYLMRGLDSVSPRDAYPDADIYTIGLKFTR